MATPDGYKKRPRVLSFTDGEAITDTVTVSGFRWYGGTTAAHTCVPTDTAGNAIWGASITAAGESVGDQLTCPREVLGITAAMDSGVMLVYIE